jgi:hypothetical protein
MQLQLKKEKINLFNHGPNGLPNRPPAGPPNMPPNGQYRLPNRSPGEPGETLDISYSPIFHRGRFPSF